jgi:hypothetical protein
MTKTQFRLGALLILTAILLYNLTSPDRYKIVSPVLLVDGITGKTWKAQSGKWKEMPHE